MAKTPQAILDRNQQWRDQNREKVRQSNQEYEALHREARNAAARDRKAANPEQRKATDRAYYVNYRRQIRQQVIEKLGGQCKECGFSDWRALQIDHVNGGGTKHRKQSTNIFAYYKEILVNLDTGHYQLLCANCNQIKRYTEGLL
jgi:hypothetical protein